MKSILVIAMLLALLSGAEAQMGDPLAARSLSGEFTAYPSSSLFPSRFYKGKGQQIPLDPALLVISCERIKQGIWRALDVKGPVNQKAYLHVRPARSEQEPSNIAVQRVLNQWVYHVDVPDATDPTTFVRTIVQVVLLELANSTSGNQSAEIPLWLSEGLSQDLIATEKMELLIPIASKEAGSLVNRLIIDGRRENPLDQAKKVFQDQAPLTFEQLSWPTTKELSGASVSVFQSSAQLFARQLLQLKNGPSDMRAMLEALPHRLNWQFALLDGFKSHFAGLLDVEKWWALQLVDFTGRDLMQTWTPEESWNKLDSIVHFPIEMRSSIATMPQRQEVTLQIIIRDWDAIQQQEALQRKAQELDVLRARVAQDLVLLVDNYRQVIGTYLKNQNFSGSFLFFKRQPGPIRNRLAESTIKELDSLEVKRQALRPVSPVLLGSSRPTAPIAP